MSIIGIMLLICGLHELYCAVRWPYFEQAFSRISDYVNWRNGDGRNSTLDEQGERIKDIGWGFILHNVFEFITMISALLFAFGTTIPYLLPLWILAFLPRRWKKYRAWRVFDNLVCACLFFVAAMVVFIGTTSNLRVG